MTSVTKYFQLPDKLISGFLKILGVAALYFLFGKLAFSLSVSNGIVTNVPFFSEGIGLSALVLFGNYAAIGVFAGQLVLALNSGIALEASICISIVNAVLAVLGRFLFYKFKLSPDLKNIRDVLFLTGIILFAVQPLSSILGNLTLYQFNILDYEYLTESLINWWMGNSIGQIIMVPFVLFLFSFRFNKRNFLLHDLPYAVIAFAVTFLLFKISNSIDDSFTFVTLFFLLPVTLLFATQKKPETVILSLLFMTVAAFMSLSVNHLNLPGQNPSDSLMKLDLLILSLQISGLMLSVLINDWKITRQALLQRENQLNELNTAKDKFFSIISHDLRGPFGSILAASELLLTEIEKMDKSEIKVIAEALHKTSENTFNLLENLLDWSKSQQNKIHFTPEITELKPLIDSSLKVFENQIIEKKLVVQNDVNMENRVYADKEMIKTVIRNLLSNAIKYSKEGGKVCINAIQHQNHSEIKITDEGLGINESQLKTMFVVGETKSQKGTHGESGTGLGLIICKDFIEKHGGKIWVESKEENGSSFYFTLPSKPL